MFFGFTSDLEKEIEEKDHLIRKLNADIKRMRALSREEKRALQKDLNTSNTRLQSLNASLNRMSAKEEESPDISTFNDTDNKQYFFDASEIVISLAKRDKAPISLAAISIDDYSILCEEYSSEKVDKILQAIVHKLVTTIRESDIFVKFADSKYMLLFPETSLSQSKIVSEKLRQAVLSCRIVDGVELSISIGVTEYSFKNDNMNLALERVEKLLKDAQKRKNSISG